MIELINKMNEKMNEKKHKRAVSKMRKKKVNRSNKNKISLILIMLLALQSMGLPVIGSVYAQVLPIQSPPEKLRIEPIYDDEPNRQPPIGYNEYDGYYADLKWDTIKSPSIADESYINIYLREATKPYKLPTPDILKEADIDSSRTSVRLKHLRSGTVYTVYGRAYYAYDSGYTTRTSPESAMSNQVRFMTDIEIEAFSHGVNQIRIVWDDVWDFNKRIGYKLYVSEHRDFSGTQPIYITSEQIGENRPVRVNEEEEKLEYYYTVRDPGRVYYIKIEPDIQDTQLKRSKESKVVAASSFILARATKMHSTDSGVIWRLDWSPVVTGLDSSDIKVSYQIYKGETDSGDLPRPIGTVDDTNFLVTISPGEDSVYFIIRALITKNGENYYPGITIESDKIIIRESEVPYRPAAPEFVEEFTDKLGNVIINYNNELTPRSAVIMWRAPKKADGSIDEDIVYNIWLTDNPDNISNPPDSAKVATGLKITPENYIIDENNIVGYKYELTGLIPNKVYYYKIEAEKIFIDYIDGNLEVVSMRSNPSVKVVVTPVHGPSDQPVVPGRPPLSIKKKAADGSYMINANSAVIQIKNKWYEKYTSGRWEYISQEEYSESDKGINYRIVEYDEGVTINVGVVKYDEEMSLEELKNMPANAIIGHSTAANDPEEDPSLNLDGKRHNVDIRLTGLEPNTTYLVWVRAARLEENLISGPSDPILITTGYEYESVLEKPAVPVFSYSQAGNTYVDLTWDFRLNSNYKYYIRYSITENLEAATGSRTVDSRELADGGLSYYRISDLIPDTVYYFWIQAESYDENGNSEKSQWSDSYIVRTLPNLPPDSPIGFGIKNAKDAITKNSITFEWVMEQDLEYILEIGRDAFFRDGVRYHVGKVSEYTVEGLISNHRYYARLYAYDPETKMESNPTNSITFRTLRSLDEYDSNEDNEKIISGDFVKKAVNAVKGIWNVEITGIDSDRLIEYMMTDNGLDYVLDLTDYPAGTNSIRIIMASKIFYDLEALRENIIIKTGDWKYEFRPGVLKESGGLRDYNYEIIIGIKDEVPANKSRRNLVAGIREFEINMYNRGNPAPILDLNEPLRIMYTYNNPNLYKEGLTWGHIYLNHESEPIKASLTSTFDYGKGEGVLSFEMIKVGNAAVVVESSNQLNSLADNGDSYITIGEAVKLMLDKLEYRSSDTYLIDASKARIINFEDIDSAQELCTKKKALSMIYRVYQLKTKGKKLDLNQFDDYLQDDNPITLKEISDLLKKI